ncbi:Proton-linked Monocarboxylate Transporter [Pleurotus pulmonarius]
MADDRSTTAHNCSRGELGQSPLGFDIQRVFDITIAKSPTLGNLTMSPFKLAEAGANLEADKDISEPQAKSDTFQEGGMAGWMTVLGASLALFSTFGAALSFGVFQDYYTRVSLSEHSPSTISWIGSTQLFLDFSIGLPAGRLFDAGYFRSLMLVGSGIYLFSYFMLSISQPHQYYQVFLSQGIGMGVGMGLVIVPSVSVPSQYFRARRSTAMGIVFVGSSIGGIIFPVMINKLVNGRLGFAWGVRASAFLMLGLLVISNLIMRPRYVARSMAADRPSVLSLAKDVPYVIAITGSSLIFWGLFFPYFYLQLFAVIRGVEEGLAFFSLTVMNAATVFGRTVPNYFADKYGAFNVAIPMTTVSGVLVFSMFGLRSAASVFILAVLYGFFSGAFISLLAAIMAAFSRSPSEVGTRIGFGMFIIGFALLTGTPITGALLNAPGYTWDRAIIFSGVVILVGVALLVVSRSMATKQKGTWRI